MVSEEKANQEVTSQQQENTPSPGAMLKARRETLGLSQQDIADKLFLKAKQINDLENDVIDEKSSVTFTKGYVRNYAPAFFSKSTNADPWGLPWSTVPSSTFPLHDAHVPFRQP